jgi:hypothetical protein
MLTNWINLFFVSFFRQKAFVRSRHAPVHVPSSFCLPSLWLFPGQESRFLRYSSAPISITLSYYITADWSILYEVSNLWLLRQKVSGSLQISSLWNAVSKRRRWFLVPVRTEEIRIIRLINLMYIFYTTDVKDCESTICRDTKEAKT